MYMSNPVLTKTCVTFFFLGAQQFCHIPQCVNSERGPPFSQEFSPMHVLLHYLTQNRSSCPSHSFKLLNHQREYDSDSLAKKPYLILFSESVLIKGVFPHISLVKLLVSSTSQQRWQWISSQLNYQAFSSNCYFVVFHRLLP